MSVYADGILVEAWDDNARTYTDYRTDPPEVRPYTAEENAAADAATARLQLQQNESALRTDAEAQIATLLTSIEALKAVRDKTNATIGPKDTKDVAREATRIARQMVRLTRLLVGALDSADTGTD